MGVYEAMRAAGYVVASVRQAVVDSSRPRDQHRDYDAALKRAEDALVDAEAEVDVLEPASGGRVFDARDENAIALLKADPDAYFEITRLCLPKKKRDKAIADALASADLEDEAYDINADFDARREARTETWMRDANVLRCEHCGTSRPSSEMGTHWPIGGGVYYLCHPNDGRDCYHLVTTGAEPLSCPKVSPVEGSGDATGGVNSPPSVVPLSELVDQVADELRAQHQPHWLADKVRATALMLKTQGL